MSYESDMHTLLSDFRQGKMSDGELLEKLQELNVTDLGFAKLDHNRSLRQGFPEVVYCEGKSLPQAREILRVLASRHDNILGTRASRELYDLVRQDLPEMVYHPEARLLVLERKPLPKDEQRVVAVVAAGTSDFPVAEEAALTAEVMGNRVTRVYDVCVAGIHRLLGKLDVIRAANVLVVVAGMEGGLASVIGGLVNKPVIAVPTSVGYGASFHGLAALLGMLNSCSAGVAVVNIDNGFGAGRLASIINHMR
jgi:pyridinium-3,5-biscarboxylic acid mononucleotide synthase